MATKHLPPTKKRRVYGKANIAADEEAAKALSEDARVIAQLVSAEDGTPTGTQLDLPVSSTPEQLQMLVNDLLSNDEPLPYAFHVENDQEPREIAENLHATLKQLPGAQEQVVRIVYRPQAVFRVRTITRCTGSLPGHTEAVLSVHFSPDGRRLASGSGDTTVRIWDILTETPEATLKGHRNWVGVIAWSPDGARLASGGNDNMVRVWLPDGSTAGRPLKGHTKWITALAWEPMSVDAECRRLASASKDGTVRVWDAIRGTCLFVLSGHSHCVTCLRWSGERVLYTGSQDRTIKVWSDAGVLIKTLKGHAHWVNSMAMNSDAVLRSGPYDHTDPVFEDPAEAAAAAKKRYDDFRTANPQELLITGSDDFTMYLWAPLEGSKPIARLTGHQQLVNHVSFSPDASMIASASFDKSVKLWDGRTGRFIASLRGHVGAVYQVCWSADSRLLCSASKDSTLKVWEIRTRKLKCDLPGHLDQVFAVDWSPDGERVASGGKDRVLKIWRN